MFTDIKSARSRVRHELWLFCHRRFLDWAVPYLYLRRTSVLFLTHEQTIRSAVECSGVGLHSGAPVSMRILPAPSGTGIVFRRTDLDGFEIEAISRNVARVSYATSLMKKGVLISTTEHVLSAFIGMGIDNAIVELDNLELPILDGSAQPFVEMIRKAGIRKQRRARKYLKIRREVEMREGNKFIAVYPSDTYSVSYSINFPHPLIGKETFQVELTNGSYLRHIAGARTFGSREDEQAMRNMGLIRGASRRKLHRADARRNRERPTALRRRICAPQSSRPGWRPGAVGEADSGQGGGRPCRTRHAHRAGFAHPARQDIVGRSHFPRKPETPRLPTVASQAGSAL